MAPSASKQKRLAEKAAKQASKLNGDPSTSTSTPAGSANGSAMNTPLTSVSAATSTDDINSMAKLQLATERYVIELFYSVGSSSKQFTGVPPVFWYLMSKVATSKLTLLRCHFMVDC
jgi:hypothetical protein